MSDNPLFEVLTSLEVSFGLQMGFFRDLIRSDEWSFVIKAHALTEAALTHLLTQQIGDARLQEVFERLPLSNDRTGKLAFAVALDLLTTGEKTFIKQLSALRNRLVHHVRDVGFRFDTHIAALDKGEQNLWCDAFAYFVKVEPGRARWRKEALTDPQMAIALGTFYLLGRIDLLAATARAERESVTKQLALLSEYVDSGRQDSETGTPTP